MSKRKEPDDRARTANGQGADDESDTDMLDVDFEWFDPQETDFQGIKVLLRQLFDVDNTFFDLSALTNLILSQPLLGSTVKVPDDETDTNRTDPYAFLTVLNIHTHSDKPEIRALVEYIMTKSQQNPALRQIPPLLASPEAQVGLILTERFINMPPEIVPPMYTMLVEEINWANSESEPYNFTHYLIITKTFTEVASKLEDPTAVADGEENGEPKKKARIEANSTGTGNEGLDGAMQRSSKAKGKQKAVDGERGEEMFYFHPEDTYMHQFAMTHGAFTYTNEEDDASDAKRAFQEAGIRSQGSLILLDKVKFQQAVAGLPVALGGSAA